MERARDFYMPQRKEEFVVWFIKQYPKESVDKWLGMTKERLRQIYYIIRMRGR